METFIRDVDALVREVHDEHELTARVADLLAGLLAGGHRLPPEVTRPVAGRHVNYPLHIAPDESWCLVSVVWDAGRRTPVHGHETWGVAGVYAGAERETRYVKPVEPGRPLTPAGEQVWRRGQVTVCCTTDDDVHAVEAAGDGPTVGLHVYGGNLGTLRRRAYDPDTGEVSWFVSGWDSPAGQP
ncbi:hypothetical protein MF672_040045 [Actinomadura sp. ATCC 31491]|uniref:Cysteine dioxygenase n=1 Tax=Actinomadura luzonensis TaxID=2805427 RepID=A0ABT0G5Q3_9ACTN|nr:hypothetical protein [Actinomadura luzonensis]MCK2219947.1 hypothetical protein [Actinomadura luzonensis]